MLTKIKKMQNRFQNANSHPIQIPIIRTIRRRKRITNKVKENSATVQEIPTKLFPMT